MSSPKEQTEGPGKRARSRREPPDSSGKPRASVNMDELRELIRLLRENGLAELELENEGFRVRLRREGSAELVAPYSEAPIPLRAAAPAPAPNPAPAPSHPGAQATTAA